MDKTVIDRQLISDMLYGEEKYILEFSSASIESFTEFLTDYSNYLMDRDMENLRRAGHKIKPVAQMLHLNELVEEYEHAKGLLINQQPDEDLIKSRERVKILCNRVIGEFRDILASCD